VYYAFSIHYLSEATSHLDNGKSQSKNNLTVLPCGTTEYYRLKMLRRGFNFADSCSQGSCDNPTVRNAAKTSLKTVNIIVHVFNDDNGNPPDGNFRMRVPFGVCVCLCGRFKINVLPIISLGVDWNLIDRAISTLRQDFASYGFDFFLVCDEPTKQKHTE
jgi:hypothetical protein